MGMHQNGPVSRHSGARRRRSARRAQYPWTCWVLVLVIFAGTFMQIFSLAQLMNQKKQIAEENGRLRELRDQVRNAEQELTKYTNLSKIEEWAKDLGMIEPEADEIRSVPVRQLAGDSDTNAQTAYGGK